MDITIDQTSNGLKLTENNITHNIVKKLYDLVYNKELYSQNNILSFAGKLKLNEYTYAKFLNKLRETYDSDVFEIEDIGTYIWFEDKEVERVIIQYFGNTYGYTDGVPVDLLLNSSSSYDANYGGMQQWGFQKKLSENTTIVTFNEIPELENYKAIALDEFKNCSNLEELNLDSIERIGPFAFFNCYKLNKLTQNPNFVNKNTLYLPKLKYLGWELFNNALFKCPQRIESLGDITYIPRRFAQNNKVLEYINPNIFLQITEIGEQAFQNCENLEIEFPKDNQDNIINIFEYLQNIGQYAFQNVKLNVKNLVLPNIQTLGGGAFTNNTYIETIDLSSSILSSITWSCFSNNTKLTTVTLPSTCKTLDNSVFEGCSLLTTINLNYITSLSDKCFKGTKLTSINIPNLTSLGVNNFENCSYLAEIISLGNITSIPNYTFYNCTSLPTINLSNITSIGTGAFRGCTNLSITLPNTLTSIGNEAFMECRSLSGDLNLPNLTSLGVRSFYKTNISSISNLGSNITILDHTIVGGQNYGIFRECTNLTTVDLSNTNITKISNYTFYGCTNLTSISFPDTLTSLGIAVFTNVDNIKLFNFPYVTSSGAFYAPTSSFQLYLPSLTTFIGSSDWYYSNDHYNSGFLKPHVGQTIKDVDLVYFKDVTEFYQCSFLRTHVKNLIINNNIPPTYINSRSNESQYDDVSWLANHNATIDNIYVPDDYINDYKATTLWGQFAEGVIKGISTMPKVATYTDWLTKRNQNDQTIYLIEEYMYPQQPQQNQE